MVGDKARHHSPQNKASGKTADPESASTEPMTPFQSNPRLQSRFLTISRIAAAAYFVFTLYALFSPNPFERVPLPIFHFSIIHAAAFFVLGLLFELARDRFPFIPVFLFLLAYGPLSEVIQPLTGRYFEWIDILEDLVGILLGVPAGHYLNLLLAKLFP